MARGLVVVGASVLFLGALLLAKDSSAYTGGGLKWLAAAKGSYATVQRGDAQLTIQKGSRVLLVEDGSHVVHITGSAMTRVKQGSYSIEVDGPSFSVRCGKSELCLRRDGSIKLAGETIEVQASSSVELSAHREVEIQAKRGVTIKSASDVDVTGKTIKLNG